MIDPLIPVNFKFPFSLNKTGSHFDYLCSAPDSNWYSVLITAFQESCVPILWCLIGILCANARFNHIEQVLYTIAPHRMPIDTCGQHTGHHCYPVCQLPNRFRIFSCSARTYHILLLVLARMRWHTGFQSDIRCRAQAAQMRTSFIKQNQGFKNSQGLKGRSKKFKKQLLFLVRA
jgi:hypothetical protein